EEASHELIYFAFDLLFAGREDLRGLPLAERKARLRSVLESGGKKAVIRYVDHVQADGDAVIESACKMSLEGIVSQKLSAPYHSLRGDGWVKSKCRNGHEVVIGGWSETGGAFRSLLVGVHKGDKFVYVGKVGTGFGAATVKKIFPRI